MSDEHDGPLSREALDRFLDQLFGFAVHGGHRFVEQQDRCVTQQCAGKCKPLTLPA